MENLEQKFQHIKGWGVDADPENDPTYPMKHWNGADHNRMNYERRPQQPINIEVLHSNERPNVTTVFGTSVPPSGLSGMMRRFAFKFSENTWTHWLALIMADRVNAVEGIVSDIAHGHVPNLYEEYGWGAEWKHNRKVAIAKLVAATAIASTAIIVLSQNKSKKKKLLKKLR